MAINLLTADVIDLALSVLRGTEWGIYQDGLPVVQPATAFSQQFDPVIAPIRAVASILGQPNLIPVTASTATFEFRQDWAIANYPQERGAFQSYDKVTLPYDIRVRLVCSGSTAKRQAFISTILAMASSTALFSLVTPEMVFTDCNVSHVSWPRHADRGVSMITADIWFQKIRQTGGSAFDSTIDAFNQKGVSLGTVQAFGSAATTVRALASFGVR